MKQYHKIQTIFKRDMSNKGKIIESEFALPEFEYLKNNEWIFAEKVDGTNIRVMWNGKDVIFGGKTDNAQMPVFLLYKLQELFEGTARKELLKKTFTDPKTGEVMTEVCLYGEGYGAKIQKGGGNYIPEGVDFVLFDIKIGHWWLQRKDIEDIAQKLGIKIVPIIGEGTLKEMIEKVKGGFKSQWGDFEAEGIVAKPKIELQNRAGHRVITKLKQKDFN